MGAAGLVAVAAAGWGARRVWRALLAGAEPPGRLVSVDEDITTMLDTLGALRELAESDGGSPGQDAVYGFSVRWGTMVAGRLVRLAHYRDEGRLAPAEQQRYDALRNQLRQALPDIDRLGLVRPAVALAGTAAAKHDHRRHHER